MAQLTDGRAKILRHLDRVIELAAQRPTVPVSVELELVHGCDLHCRWCPYGREGIELEYMGLEDAKTILTTLSRKGVKSVVFSGRGEPLLHPNTVEIFDHAHALGLSQGVYTNGVHLTPAIISRLTTQFTWAYFSVDVVNGGQFERLKGARCWGQLLDGVRELARARDRQSLIGMGFLVGPENYRDIVGSLAVYGKIGFDYLMFKPRVMANEPDRTTWVRQAIYDLRSIRKVPNVFVELHRFYDYMRFVREYARCQICHLTGFVDWQGDVLVCRHRAEKLGNLLTQPDEVWSKVSCTTVDERCPELCKGHYLNSMLHNILDNEPIAHESFL